MGECFTHLRCIGKLSLRNLHTLYHLNSHLNSTLIHQILNRPKSNTPSTFLIQHNPNGVVCFLLLAPRHFIQPKTMCRAFNWEEFLKEGDRRCKGWIYDLGKGGDFGLYDSGMGMGMCVWSPNFRILYCKMETEDRPRWKFISSRDSKDLGDLVWDGRIWQSVLPY